MKDTGKIAFSETNDLNIPVGIFLTLEDEEKPDGPWQLVADCYQPRRDRIEPGAFDATGTKKELQTLVKKQIVPLYEAALEKVKGIALGINDSLYFWKEE